MSTDPKERSTALTFEDWYSFFKPNADRKIADYQRHAAEVAWDAALSHRSRPETESLSSGQTSTESPEAVDGDRT